MLPIHRRLFVCRRSLELVFLMAWLTMPVVAQEIRPADRVTVIRWNTELHAGEKTVCKVGVGTNLDVDKVNGDWLWIASVKGYVNRSDVVPYDQAVQHFTMKIQATPSSSSVFRDRAAVWKGRGEYDIAIKDYTEAIRLNPTGASGAYIGRGDAWERKRDLDLAIADYTESIRIDPSSALGYCCRGTAWRTKGEPVRAIADLSEAIRLDPSHQTARLERALAKAGLFKYDEALEDIDTVAKHSDDPWFVYHRRSNVNQRRRDYTQVAADCERCLELGEATMPFFYRGMSYYQLQRPHDAIQDLQRFADDTDEFSYTPRTWLALAHSAIGKHSEADHEFQRMLPSEHFNTFLRIRYAQFLASCPSDGYRNGKLALEIASKADLKKGSLVDKYDVLAMAHAECGDFTSAVASQTQAIELAEEHQYHTDYIAGLRVRLKLYTAGQPYRHPVYPVDVEMAP